MHPRHKTPSPSKVPAQSHLGARRLSAGQALHAELSKSVVAGVCSGTAGSGHRPAGRDHPSSFIALTAEEFEVALLACTSCSQAYLGVRDSWCPGQSSPGSGRPVTWTWCPEAHLSVASCCARSALGRCCHCLQGLLHITRSCLFLKPQLSSLIPDVLLTL